MDVVKIRKFIMLGRSTTQVVKRRSHLNFVIFLGVAIMPLKICDNFHDKTNEFHQDPTNHTNAIRRLSVAF